MRTEIICWGLCVFIIGTSVLALATSLLLNNAFSYKENEFVKTDPLNGFIETEHDKESLEPLIEKALYLTKEHFQIDNYTDYSIDYFKDSVWYSKLTGDLQDNGTITNMQIHIGLYYNNSEWAEGVFAHEYTHYILYKLNLNNHDMQEVLTDTYCWWAYEDEWAEQYGSKNERREHPYTIVMNKIFEEDNFECLDRVFESKITSVDDYLDRLDKFCGIDIEQLKQETGYN